MNYLHIPLMAGYKFDLGKNFSIKPEVGGYFAVGINGDSFVKGVDNFDQPYEARVNTFSNTESREALPLSDHATEQTEDWRLPLISTTVISH